MANGTWWFHCLEWAIYLSPSINTKKHLKIENFLQTSLKYFHKFQQDSVQPLLPPSYPWYRDISGRKQMSILISHCCPTSKHKLKCRNHLPRKKPNPHMTYYVHKSMKPFKMFKDTTFYLNTRIIFFPHCNSGWIQVAQRACGVFILADIKNSAGLCPGQPAVSDAVLKSGIALGDLQQSLPNLKTLWYVNLLKDLKVVSLHRNVCCANRHRSSGRG